MQYLASSLKGFQVIILGLLICMLDASADTKDDSISEHMEKQSLPSSIGKVYRPCENSHWCLDTEMITTKNIFVERNGRFSQVAIGLPRSHEIKNALEVKGKILAEEILVKAVVADYVFTPSYDLKPLKFVEGFINENHHLPGIPSSAEVEAAGGKIPIGDSYRGLLEKVEELTLYTIEQDKRIAALEKLLMSQYEIKGSSPGGR